MPGIRKQVGGGHQNVLSSIVGSSLSRSFLASVGSPPKVPQTLFDCTSVPENSRPILVVCKVLDPSIYYPNTNNNNNNNNNGTPNHNNNLQTPTTNNKHKTTTICTNNIKQPTNNPMMCDNGMMMMMPTASDANAHGRLLMANNPKCCPLFPSKQQTMENPYNNAAQHISAKCGGKPKLDGSTNNNNSYNEYHGKNNQRRRNHCEKSVHPVIALSLQKKPQSAVTIVQ